MHRGAVCELLVSSDLLARGYDVYRSVSSSGRFDIVAASRETGGLVRIEVRSVSRKNDGSISPAVYEKDNCDVYGFVTADGEITYMVREVAWYLPVWEKMPPPWRRTPPQIVDELRQAIVDLGIIVPEAA